MAELYSNKYIGFLQYDISELDTQIVLNTPPPDALLVEGQWRLKLGPTEIVKVVEVVDNVTFNIERAQENTEVLPHQAGTRAVHLVTAESLYNINDDAVHRHFPLSTIEMVGPLLFDRSSVLDGSWLRWNYADFNTDYPDVLSGDSMQFLLQREDLPSIYWTFIIHDFTQFAVRFEDEPNLPIEYWDPGSMGSWVINPLIEEDGDYIKASDIFVNPIDNITKNNIQESLEEIANPIYNNELAHLTTKEYVDEHLNDPEDSHDDTSISYDPNTATYPLDAVNIHEAFDSTGEWIRNHVHDDTDSEKIESINVIYDATDSNLIADTVQEAIDEIAPMAEASEQAAKDYAEQYADAGDAAVTDYVNETFIPQIARAQANGVASLGNDGKIPTSQLPRIRTNKVFVVASQAAMLALSAKIGDTAVRTDNNTQWILWHTPASTLSNWVELNIAAAVDSVDGRTGDVTLNDLYDAFGAASAAETTAINTANSYTDLNKLDINSNLSDISDAPTARGNLGLGDIATHDISEFDPAGAADTAESNSIAYADSIVTYETLDGIGDVGTGAGQLADGQHNHDLSYDTIGSAVAAEINAIAYADSLAPNYDPTGSADAAEANAKDYADGLAPNYEPIGAVDSAITNHETTHHGFSIAGWHTTVFADKIDQQMYRSYNSLVPFIVTDNGYVTGITIASAKTVNVGNVTATVYINGLATPLNITLDDGNNINWDVPIGAVDNVSYQFMVGDEIIIKYTSSDNLTWTPPTSLSSSMEVTIMAIYKDIP